MQLKFPSFCRGTCINVCLLLDICHVCKVACCRSVINGSTNRYITCVRVFGCLVGHGLLRHDPGLNSPGLLLDVNTRGLFMYKLL